MKICEEAGTGIDKVIASVEAFQLPAPDFAALLRTTKATLFAHRKLADMDSHERVRACYQHASLCLASYSIRNRCEERRTGVTAHQGCIGRRTDQAV